MDFQEKLTQIIQYYKLSPTSLADRINVQRSSISHLISGRNKPSLEFIVKLTDTFPELNFDWLVRDKGNMISSQKSELNSVTNVTSKNTNVNSPTLFDNLLPENEPKKISPIVSSSKEKIIEENKLIAKVLILYKDGSFEVYQ